MNNNKNKPNKQEQTNQRQKNVQSHGSNKKQGQNADVLHGEIKYHDQERPETRMTR